MHGIQKLLMLMPNQNLQLEKEKLFAHQLFVGLMLISEMDRVDYYLGNQYMKEIKIKIGLFIDNFA